MGFIKYLYLAAPLILLKVNEKSSQCVSCMFPFEKILTYIANEQCVLAIGPELMWFEDKPMNLYLRDKLYQQYAQDVTHYYQHDGLFLFPADDESVKSDLAQSMRTECFRLAQSPNFQEAILKNIARLPFHLIISINPDTFLSDTFYKYGVTHRFAHYRKGDKPSDEVSPPTRQEPLIYNVAGSVLEDETLVLDYDDLFSLLSSSFGASGLPIELQNALGKIRTYIFIGFPFEKWYTQVILRIFCGKAAYRKYAGPHKISPDTHTFLINQFKIDFWDAADGDFWQALLQAAEQYTDPDPQRLNVPFLRKLLENPLSPEETSIIRSIQNGQYAKAVNDLILFAKGSVFENEATMCSARYQTIAQNQAKMDSRDFLTALNQIVDALIQLVRQIAGSK